MVSTYNYSQRQSIANSKYIAPLLFICSLLLWGAGALFDIGTALFELPQPAGAWLAKWEILLRPVALAIYGAAAFLMSSYLILERRVTWQPFIMLLFTGACFNIQPDAVSALTMLAFIMIIGLLFRCDETTDARRQLFTLFVGATALAILFPQFTVILLPLLIYPAMSGKLDGRSFMAALLGVATPAWLLGGLAYLFPGMMTLFDGYKEYIAGELQISKVEVTLPMLATLAAELVITVPAIAHFMLTTSIGRVRLRRRMLFCVILDILLWGAGWWCPGLFKLFLVWRMPLLSLLAAYIFPVLPQKTSNIYMSAALLMWLAVAIIGLWIG